MSASDNVVSIGWDLRLGRLALCDVGLGVAIDVEPGPEVTFYAIYANLLVTDAGGMTGMWVGSHGRAVSNPSIVLVPVWDDEVPLTNARAEEILVWCGQAGIVASLALERVLTDWGDHDAEARLDAAIAELNAPAEVRRLVTQVLATLRRAAPVLLGQETTS